MGGKGNSSLKKENDALKKQLDEIANDLQTLKIKMAVGAEGGSQEPPNVQDVQFLSDGFDDLNKSKEDIVHKLLGIEARLYHLSLSVEKISQAIDNAMEYSYQYNLKIVGMPQEKRAETAEETTDLCLKMFDLMGAEIERGDIDIAHRIPLRNQARRVQQQNPIICKFTRRLARNEVLKHRKNTNNITSEALGLNSQTDLKVAVYNHLTPRLQELLYQAKTFQKTFHYKYCWTKETKILLRKQEDSEVVTIQALSQLEALRTKESTNS